MSERILIIGAGFAGMWSALGAVRLLDEHGRTEDVEVALVAPKPELQIRPRFYEDDVGSMRAPLQEIFDSAGVRFIPGMVDRIRAADSEVDIRAEDGSPSTLSYDRLVLAMGSRLFRPEVPGLSEHGFSVDQIGEATELEQHVKGLANLPDSPARNTVVVAGGGFTGIETAAEMPARLRAALGDGSDVRVIIVDRNSEVGHDLGPGPRPIIEEALTDLGVEFKLGSAVTSIDANGLTTDSGERIESKTVIWTAGLRASTLTAQIDAPKDNLGRLHVDRNLSVPGTERIFATGDVANAATDDEGNHTLMSCQHAMNLGRSAGHNVAASLLGVESIPYSQPQYVTCLDLGPWGAVYTEGWGREVKLKGAEAKQLKHAINSIHIYPPNADRAAMLEAADPRRIVVA